LITKANIKKCILLKIKLDGYDFKTWVHLIMDEYIPRSSCKILRFRNLYLSVI